MIASPSDHQNVFDVYLGLTICPGSAADRFIEQANSAGIGYHIEKLDLPHYRKTEGFVQNTIENFETVHYLINNV